MSSYINKPIIKSILIDCVGEISYYLSQPLDRDQVDLVAECFKVLLSAGNGNITNEELLSNDIIKEFSKYVERT